MAKSLSSIKSETMEWPQRRQQLEFSMDWMLKTLGFVAAVLFGIWAPLSYKAALDGNRSNDTSQVQLLTSIDELNRRLEEQHRILEEQISKTNMINEQLHLMTKLSLLDYCTLDDRSTMSPCSELLGIDGLNDLASEVMKASQTTTSTPVRTSTVTATATMTMTESSTVTSTSPTFSDSSSILSTRSAPSISTFPTTITVGSHGDVPTFGEPTEPAEAFLFASVFIFAILLITTFGILFWRRMRKFFEIELEQ